MKQIYWLSADNILLGKEEVLALTKPKSYELHDRILVLDSSFKDFGRLAYTKRVYNFLFSCRPEFLADCINRFDWNKVYKKSFCVRVHDFHIPHFTESGLADLIWRRLKRPKADLKNPHTLIEFLFVKGVVFCGLFLHANDNDFFSRVAHLRPGFHPSSLSPKLARCLVNLSGVQKKQVLLDPFCGSGGIIIEAAMVGCKAIGSDVDEKMLVRTAENLKYFNLKAKLLNEDALKIGVRPDVIVTDPPYGRSSFTTKKVSSLYNSFLSHAYFLLKRKHRLVIVFPSTFKFKSKFRLICMVPVYVHRTLTRNIYVLEKV
ncbi:MAG: DNA methyltransferase [Candidatus Nanoarchaeia archaeon]